MRQRRDRQVEDSEADDNDDVDSSCGITISDEGSAVSKPCPTSTAKGLNPKVPKFISSLYELLVTPANHSAISFNADGTAIEIKNLIVLEKAILPRYFRHSQMTSFTRQLNNYNFELKVSRPGVHQTFMHPYFVKDRMDLLTALKRRKSAAERGVEQKQSREIMVLKEQVNAQLAQIQALRTQLADMSCMNRHLVQENRQYKHAVESLTNGSYDMTKVDTEKDEALGHHCGRSPSTDVMPLFSLVSPMLKVGHENRKRERNGMMLSQALDLHGAGDVIHGMSSRVADVICRSPRYSISTDDHTDWTERLELSLFGIPTESDNDELVGKRYHSDICLSRS